MSDYLFLATIPSVGRLIKASRRTEDIWAGSMFIAFALKSALTQLKNKDNIEFIFPSHIPEGNADFADISNKVLLKLKGFSNDEVYSLAREMKEGINKALCDLINFAFSKCKISQVYKELAYFQAEGTIEFFWTALPVNDDYIKTKREIDRYLGYLKDSLIRMDSSYQGYELVRSENFEIPFEQFQKSTDYERYCRGAYTCTVCKRNSIIGANEKDYRGTNLWKALWLSHQDKFKEGERLCGFCLGKRFLSEFINKKGFPSTSEIACTTFKRRIIEDEALLNDLYNILGRYKLPYCNMVPALKRDLEQISDSRLEKIQRLLSLDGEWFMVDTWRNLRISQQFNISPKETKRIAEDLEKLYKNRQIRPSEMYAVLKLDGDNMGAKISVLDKEGHISLSRLQSEFISEVKEIIEREYGIPIYIGGDDVFAFLPLENALSCAREIRDRYIDKMREIAGRLPDSDEKYKFTMTGAILLAHHLLPLHYVLQQVEELEGLSKESKGKDSIGIKYIKHSLASEEVILKWNKIGSFEKIRDIPKSFIYQIDRIFNAFNKDASENNLEKNKALIRSLLKRKIEEKDLIGSIIDRLLEIDTSLDIGFLVSLLKVSNFIKGA